VQHPVHELQAGSTLELDRQRITQAELQQLRVLCAVTEDGSVVRLQRQPGSLKVGAVRTTGATVVVPAERLTTATLLGMVLHVSGTRRLSGEPLAAELGSGSTHDILAVGLAALLVAEVERSLREHIAQGYVARTEPLQTLRGRPSFIDSATSRASAQVVCTYYEKQTDILLNQLILGGLEQTLWYLPDGLIRRRASTVRAVMLELAAQPRALSRHMFRTASARLNRQTEHYRRPLALSEALVFGFQSGDPALDVAAPVFDLGLLFEYFIAKVLRDAAPALGLEVRVQASHGQVLVDAAGGLYRSIRPDVLVFKQGRLVAVLDAKYKPRYLDGPVPLSDRGRVSREDIFQMFFYSERLRRKYQVAELPSMLLAPQLYAGTAVVDAKRRSISWNEGGIRETLKVLPCPLDEMTSRAAAGRTADDVLAGAAELKAALAAL
jgi:hypothetical protein